MKAIKQRVAIIVLCLSILPLSAFAQTGNYTTPDSWAQHQTGNGFKFTMDSTDVGIGNLKIGLTSRYTAMSADSTDQYFYQYIRAYLSDVKLGSGTMKISANVRGATDIDGYSSNLDKYRFYPTLTDSQLINHDEDWDFRIYDANVVLDNVIDNTIISAGRIRINHLSDWKVDGGELLVGNNMINAYAFYGVPVSYYDWLNEQTFGGGINTSFFNDTLQFRGEVVYFADDSEMDADTLTWKVRGDYNLAVSDILDTNVYGDIGMIEKAMIYEVGVFGDILKTGTTFNAWLKGQYDRNDDNISAAVSDYEYVIGTESEYVSGGLNLYQGLGNYFAVGVGVEHRYNFDEWYGDRDYTRVNGNVDFFNVIPNNYISITADYYIVPSYNQQDEEQKLFFGGRITQNVTNAIAVWAGAGFTNYQYNSHPVDLIPSPVAFEDDKEDNNVYTAYIGGRWSITDNIMVQADYMYEMSDVINSMDSKNDEIHYAQLWLNVGF